MMTIVFGAKALKRVKLLPQKQSEKFAHLLVMLRDDPFAVGLHTKLLSGKFSHLYSFRISRDWRAIFSFRDQETIQIVDIGHRRDIYR